MCFVVVVDFNNKNNVFVLQRKVIYILYFVQNGCVVSTCSDGSVKTWSHRGVEITTLYGHTQRANGCDIAVKLVEDSLEGKSPSKYLPIPNTSLVNKFTRASMADIIAGLGKVKL